MSVTVAMPEVAETVVEGTIVRWMKQEGDRVGEYEPLVEIVTDKVNVEVPSPVAGVLKRILAAPNAVVPVGAPLAIIEEEHPAGATPAPDGAPPPAAAAAAPAAPPVITAARTQDKGEPDGRRYTPLVRRLAEEHHVDLRQLTGTGGGGRITRRDVLGYLDRRQTQPARAPSTPARPAAPAPATPAPKVSAAPGDQSLPLTPVRAIIAKRMAQSRREVPDAWTMVEVDVTGLVRLRTSLRDDFQQREGINLTYLPFAIKAAVGALKDYPTLNTVWAEDRLIIKKEVNVSVAIDRDEGLAVPVVHRADQHSIAGLAREVHRLAERARAGKLTIGDVQGGTFTIDNTGVFGSVMSQPIVNQPQIAVLTTEAIIRRPVVRDDDAIAIRFMMNMCISFDHRAIDGALAGRFMQSVKRKMEAYAPGQNIW